MNLYMLYNAEINQNQILNLECKYGAKRNVFDLCLGAITGVLVVSNTIELPARKSSYTQDSIKYIAPKYSAGSGIHDEWLHFLLYDPLDKQFVKAPSKRVCLCAIKECELTDDLLQILKTVFLSKMVILDAVSPQTERIFLANGWVIAKAYS